TPFSVKFFWKLSPHLLLIVKLLYIFLFIGRVQQRNKPISKQETRR
ncbi:unnamed protein product, partial [Brassica napus]